MLTDKADAIREKIRKSVTDFTSEVTFEPETRPGVANLLTIHSLASGKSPQQICVEAKGLNTGQYKGLVADALVAHLEPIRSDIDRYLADPGYLATVIEEGCERARETAERTLHEVKEKVGMNGFSLARLPEVARKERVE